MAAALLVGCTDETALVGSFGTAPEAPRALLRAQDDGIAMQLGCVFVSAKPLRFDGNGIAVVEGTYGGMQGSGVPVMLAVKLVDANHMDVTLHREGTPDQQFALQRDRPVDFSDLICALAG